MPVYFARAGSDGLVKIGFAVTVARRLKHLSAGCPTPLILLREAPGTRQTEAWLHRHFAEARRHGEWFEFREEMLTVEPGEISPVASRAPKWAIPCEEHLRVIDLWPSASHLARDLGLPDGQCVRKWRARKRIPAWHFQGVVEAARHRGFADVTVAGLVEAA